MFKLVNYIIDSQQGYARLWVFSFASPSKYQIRYRERWFFDPFFSARLGPRRKKLLYKKLYNYKEYPLLSIFIDVNVLFERYRAFWEAIEAYQRWVVTQSRWFKVWEFKIKPRVLPYLFVAAIFAVTTAINLFWPRIYFLYKKKIWLVYYKLFFNFIWFKVFKKVILFCFYCFYLVFEALSVELIFGGCIAFSFLLFFIIKQLVFWYWPIFGFAFDRGVVVSGQSSYKGCFVRASRFVWDYNRTVWRLSSFLETRYAKILERFESQQFPFRFDDELFVDYMGVRSAGWLKFNSPFSRLTFYSNFFPVSLGPFFKKKFFRWKFLHLPLVWSVVWGRYPNRRFNKFYARNLILYRPKGEVCLLKQTPVVYDFFLSFYLEKYRSSFSFLKIVSFKKFPWWVYRQRLLVFLFAIRFTFFYFMSLISDERVFRGDLVKLYRPRKKRDFFYNLGGQYLIARPFHRLFFIQSEASKIYSRVLNLYTSFWILIFCCLEPFSWVLMFPIKFLIRVRKNTFVKLAFFLLLISCLLVLKSNVFTYFIF